MYIYIYVYIYIRIYIYIYIICKYVCIQDVVNTYAAHSARSRCLNTMSEHMYVCIHRCNVAVTCLHILNGPYRDGYLELMASFTSYQGLAVSASTASFWRFFLDLQVCDLMHMRVYIHICVCM